MLVKTSTSKLCPGMYVSNPGLSEINNPHIYLVEGIIPDSQSIDRIKQDYFDVYIDTDKGTYFADNKAEKEDLESLYRPFTQAATSSDAAQFNLSLILKNFSEADRNYSELISQYKTLAKSMSAVDRIDVSACWSLADQLSRMHNDIIISMLLVSRMREYDAYSYTHSLNVSILAVIAARHFGFSEESQNTLGMAGIFHDLGKLLIPDKILKKPGKLTVGEYGEIKRHPVYGKEILLRQQDVPAEVVRVAHEHHEHFDGTGYPHALKQDQISRSAALVSILDTYDALRSDRYYREAISSHKAICVIYSLKGKAFHPELVDKLIQLVGIYPAGSIVVFRCGLKAVVTEQNPDNLLRPKVSIILDEHNRYCPPKALDLRERDPDGPYTIVDTLTNKECRVHLASLLKAKA